MNLTISSYSAVGHRKPPDVAVDLIKVLNLVEFGGENFGVDCDVIVRLDQPADLQVPLCLQLGGPSHDGQHFASQVLIRV
jgi:hypothetical protein